MLERVRAFILNVRTGEPLPRVALSVVLDFTDAQTGRLRSTVAAILASDHAGYVSADLSSLADLSTDIKHIWLRPKHDESLQVDALDYSDDTLKHAIVPIRISPFTLGEDCHCVAGSLPAIQNPDPTDWKLSPSSFGNTSFSFVGDNVCEDLSPSHAPTRTFRFGQLLRSPASGQNPSESLIAPLPISQSCDPDFGDEFIPALQPTCLRLGVLLSYEMCWQPIAHGLGEILYSLTLAPCEAIKIATIEWSRRDTALRGEDASMTEELAHNQRRDRAIEEVVNATIQEWQRGGSVMGGLGLSGMIGPISGALALGGGYSSSSAERSVAADTVERLADTVSQASAAVRQLHSTVIVQASQTEAEQIQTRVVTNNNHCHALTVLYYEVVRHFIVTTRLASKQDVVLVRYQWFVRRFDLDAAVVNRWTLEAGLLDRKLRSCFDAAERKYCARLAALHPKPPTSSERDITFTELQATFVTGDEGTDDDPFLNIILKDGTTVRCKQRDPSDADSQYLFGHRGHDDFEEGETDEFGLIPDQRLKWGDLRQVEVGLDGGDDWRLARFRLEGVSSAGTRILFEGEFNVTLSNSTARRKLIEPPADQILGPTNEGAEADDCCAQRLLDHLNANRHYYNRILWLAEDPDQRAKRFDYYQVTLQDEDRAGETGRLIDLIENRIVGVLGDYVAFPITGDSLAQRLVPQNPKPIERIISVPTRGAFAEARLGHCNACEEVDTTRFWDWSESPCPCNAPEILPISAGSRARDPQLDPQSLPASLLRVAEPLNEPDPTGLKAVLDLLGKPEIFRDMSMSEEVAGLLGKLVESAAAIQKAKIEALAPRSQTADSATSDSSARPTTSAVPSASSTPQALQTTQPPAPTGAVPRHRSRQERADLANREERNGRMSAEAAQAARTEAVLEPDPAAGPVTPVAGPTRVQSFVILLDRVAAAPSEDAHPIFFGRIAPNYLAHFAGIPPFEAPLFSFEIHGEGEHVGVAPTRIGLRSIFNTEGWTLLPDDFQNVEAVIRGISFSIGSAFFLSIPSLGGESAVFAGGTDVAGALTNVRGTFRNLRRIGIYHGE